jgi:uncharacterized membrane protein
MRKRTGGRLFAASVATMILLAPTGAAAAGEPAVRVRMVDLGTFGGPFPYSVAKTVNDRGDVGGMSTTPDGTATPVLWRHGNAIDLGVTGEGTTTGVRDINERGQVVGCGGARGFLWEDGVLTDLSAGGMTCAVAINERGQIAGMGQPHDRPPIVIRWDNGVFTVAPPEVQFASPFDINERGDVLGETTLGGAIGPITGFVWSGATVTILGSADAGYPQPRTFNDRGQVCGYLLIGDRSRSHPIRWYNGTTTDLAPTAGSDGMAVSINARGDIVGFLDGQPFLWSNGILTNPGPPGRTGGAAVINDRGDVAGEVSALDPADGTQPFFRHNGRTVLLPGNGAVTAINNRGVAVGYTVTPSGETHATMWFIT